MIYAGGVPRLLRATPALAVLLVLVVVASAAAEPRVTIRRGEHGIPHIVADDWEGLGYGYGYSIAQDDICILADSYTTVRGERSRYFGPDGSWVLRGNGSTNNNLDSDFFFQRIIDDKTIEKLLDQPPPLGPRPEVRQIVHGYVQGYNRELADVPADKVSDPACKGKPWVHPIEEIDAYRRFYALALLASQAVAIDGIGGAQPPTPPLMGTPNTTRTVPEMLGELKARLPLGGVGSNAVALGKDATDNGMGMLLGNPHFPWTGSERFYQSQLTIPGKIDVEGGSLMGVPLVLIGHTRGLAWSHTVSTAYRFTPFELKLVPGSPTTYLYDGKPTEMTRRTVTVKVPGPDGALTDRTRTLYSTLQGPILTSILGLPLFPWTASTAYAMGDANASNFRYLNHFFETDLAQSTDELDAVLKRNQGIPWVNTIASDRAGRAYYADLSVVPNVSDAKVSACGTNAVGVAAYNLLGLPVLDGSRSACAWDNDPDAAQKGIFGPSHLPSLFRSDYVTNSNDSYWLANPHQPLEGFARIVGDQRTARSLRTRSGLVMVEERLKGGGKFSRQDLQDLDWADRQYAGELWRDDLVSMCKSNPTLTGSNGPVDVSAACPVLERWDLHDNLDSRGAVLFRRFATRALAKVGGVAPAAVSPFRVPFDVNDPVNTPRGLNTDSADVRKALADAVTDLRAADIPLDAPLRDYQYELRGDEKIPIHGGPGTVGVFNAINVTWDPKKAYAGVPHGSSYIQVVHFVPGDCPDTRTILTYSQSADPTSPWYADQTRMFSRKEWATERFCDAAVWGDPALKVTNLGGGAKAARLLRSARVRRARGGRALVRVQVARRANVSVKIRRGRKVVRVVRAAGVSGTKTLRFKLPRGARSPRVTIRVVARNAAQLEGLVRRIPR